MNRFTTGVAGAWGWRGGSRGFGGFAAELKWQAIKRGDAEAEPLEGVLSGPCQPYAEDDALETCVASARRKSAERSSLLGLSGALAIQINPNVFIGGEVRYLRSYAGLGLNSFEGHAVFVGPTLYAKLSETVSISAAYSAQIAGKSEATPGRRLDLDNFARHQAKLKISYEF